MIGKKSIAALLTGASVASLVVAGGSALAAGSIYTGNYTDLIIAAATDFVILDNGPPPFHATGDVINQTRIGSGGPDSIAFLVRDDAIIDGSLINTSLAVMSAKDLGVSAPAIATGIRIDGTVSQVVNHGLIGATTLSVATQGGREAYAEARGVEYDATGLTDGVASLWNDGDINAFARAVVADESGATASAFAVGVDEYATGSGAGIGSSALSLVSNDGLIDVSAQATAKASDTYTGSAFATATATGVAQYVRNAESVAASLVNTGNIVVDAFVKATGLGDHRAYASGFAVGVDQYAEATGSGTSSAAVAVNNTGTIDVYTTANASATAEYAEATATALGVNQEAFNAEHSSALVNNSGDIRVTVLADASGTSAYAFASGVGVLQSATGNGTSGSTAQSTVVNTSLWSIDAVADAYAYASSYTASATAEAYGVGQYANNAEDSAALVDNDGSINATANAYATAVGGQLYATADATAAAVWQSAAATNGALSTAAATVLNTGDITASAYAEANNSGSLYAYAYAYASGVYKDVDTAHVATALVENTGDIHATAVAKADSYNFSAYAYAWAVGVQQELDANDVSGSVASATVTNESLLSIDAIATASAFNTFNAVATASAAGVSQEAHNAEFGSALVDNSGAITADANAFASATYSNSAFATANAWGVYQSASGNFSPGSEADATVHNSGEITATAFAKALATHTYGDFATASGSAIGVEQNLFFAQTATALVQNTGDIHATVTAIASVYSSFAHANARAAGVSQSVSASTYAAYGTASATVTNASLLSIDAVANADAEAGTYASAEAFASGVSQEVWNAYSASALVENSGSITALGDADATATYGDSAYAFAFAGGVYQDVDATSADGSTASATVNNSGSIDVAAYADANVNNGSTANASAYASGIYQEASNGDATSAVVNNSGDIHAYAWADADADNRLAQATAGAFGVVQFATANYTEGSSALATVTNESLLSIEAIADAYASGSDLVLAVAVASGVFQEVTDGDLASALVDNAGSILADAYAKADATYSDAFARATATGVEQIAGASALLDGSLSVATTYNDGTVTALAYAEADALELADADAKAYGILQRVGNADFLDATVENGGTIRADAYANADGYPAGAEAEAAGVVQIFQNPTANPADAVFDNWGSIEATAYAGAFASYDFDVATAYATGYYVRADGDLVLDASNSGSIFAAATADAYDVYASAVGIYAEGETKTGIINNSGVIRAEAYADGVNGTATAVGIWDPSYETTVEITNSGLISVYAEGPFAAAAGIVIDPLGGAPSAVPEVAIAQIDSELPYATIHNDGGTIWAGIVETGEPVPVLSAEAAELLPFVERGDAIYTENAPNQVLIQLTGNNSASHDDALAPVEDGYIFGNIDISDDDVIVVFDGKTWFDGIVNPDFDNEGFLDIVDDGNLLLLNRANGPSAVFVDEFFMDETGTLGIEVNADPFDHPFVNANVATVDGRLNVVYQADLYDDLTVYHGVVQANDLDALFGSFDTITDNSALLFTSQFFDAANDEIDVVAERIAFGDVVGLTKNQSSVGDAIENVYDDLEYDSSFTNLVAHLFTFDDEEYPIQLDSLAGAEFAQYLQSVIWSTSQLNRTVTQRMECDGAWAANMQTASLGGQSIQPVADVVETPVGCFQPGRVSLWADVSGSWNKQDGDKNAPGYDEDQYALLVGADYAFDDSFYMGVAVGYLDSDMDFKWFGNKIDYDGLQLAVYGGYDDTENYIRGILSYGTYDGSSHRYVSVEPSNPIDPSGSPDSNVFSFYGELGHRFGMGAETNITPFAGLSLAQGEIESFTEKDPNDTGAALHIHESDGNSAASVLGLRLGGDWMFGGGMFTPDISVAWMHEFDEERQTVKASFAEAPSGADFKVVGSKTARDSAVINVGGTFGITDGVDFSVIYDGRYSSDYSANAVIGRVGVKF